jgi:hypothetical protein
MGLGTVVVKVVAGAMVVISLLGLFERYFSDGRRDGVRHGSGQQARHRRPRAAANG